MFFFVHSFSILFSLLYRKTSVYPELYFVPIFLGSEPGDTPHCATVAAVVVVSTWVHVAAIDVQVVRLGAIVRRTRPPVAVARSIVEGPIVHVPGISEMSPHAYRNEAPYFSLKP